MSKLVTRFAVQVLSWVAQHPFVQAWLKQVLAAYQTQRVVHPSGAAHEVPEVLPLVPVVAEAAAGARLNLLVPAVSPQHVFGGIATALQIFDALRGHFASVRIIVTDEVAPAPQPGTFYGAWPVVSLGQPAPLGNHIVAAGSRWGKTLAVHGQDHFMATAWWTAHNGFALLRWQQQQFPALASRRLLYLIQDYEPGFYAWSSRYLLAQSTYAFPEQTIAVVNSHWLADHLVAQGHRFAVTQVLTPRINPALAAVRNRHAQFAKKPILLVYGRPGTERNAFSLLLSALRLWAQQYPLASQWQVLSVGEPFPAIDLGSGCQLQNLGKLSLQAYADLLCDTAVGFSLMVSPHPSYPPLEMAAFGAQVLTNRFANKDLARVAPGIVSADPPSPAGFAAALQGLTQAFDARSPAERSVPRSDIRVGDGFLDVTSVVFDWAEPLVNQWLQAAPSP